MNPDDLPLSDAFYQNPLQYMQNHVRNLNNQIFLSEYHINGLYVLLLLGRNSPWDILKGNSPRAKEEIDTVLNQKVHQVKLILENLSNMYEDKSKKSAISQIEKLMGILKSKKKSIFIEKDRSSISFQRFQALSKMAQQMQESSTKPKTEQNHNEAQRQKEQTQIIPGQLPEQSLSTQPANNQLGQQTLMLQVPQAKNQNDGINPNQIVYIYERNQGQSLDKTSKQTIEEQPHERPAIQQQEIMCHTCGHDSRQMNQQHGQQIKEHNGNEDRPKLDSGKEVFSIFYGLSNMSNLTAMALSIFANIVQHNTSQRYIKFKMSESYIMTIKSEDPLHFDKTSQLRKIPSQTFVNHIFPYLTASELFQCRSVCKQWLQFVKQSWHSTFKREMFVQLLACQFCKDIQFYYKTIQLRNPFFQKISLLIHALIEIINWEIVANLINTNTLPLQLKRVMIILLRLIGEPIHITNLNSITDAFYDQHKDRLTNLKQKISQFFSNLSGSDLSINDLRTIKTHFLDDPFMRVEDVGADDKTPLLLNLLVKQINLQQILRNHIYLAQEYLLNTKKRLDNISKKMVYQKGYLQGVYKILLLKSTEAFSADSQTNDLPNFNDMLQSIFSNRNCERPDFVLRSKNSSTEIYLDNATKLDIILSTVYGINQKIQKEPASSQGRQKVELTQEERKNKQQKNQIVPSVDVHVSFSQQTQHQDRKQPENQRMQEQQR